MGGIHNQFHPAAVAAGDKQFSEERVRSTLKRISAAKGKSSQGRLESFFGPVTVKPSDKKKAAEVAAGAAKKGSKGGLGLKAGVKKGPLGKKN
eukprot:jgi/Chrzof1/6931/Cz02g04020.t1